MSLNSFAENLTLKDDEIIFVDWNSDNRLGTLPEMFQDTLSEKCKKLLKVVVVPQTLHDSLIPEGHRRPVIESIARNTGIYRTNSSNKWVLCTNTDILIDTSQNMSLSELVANYESGFYQAFRYEIPEYVWSGFDRTQPRAALKEFEKYGRTFDAEVSRIFFGNETPDAPGDFQLADRDAWFESGAFPESMVLGSHVDSIVALKMASIRKVSILRDDVKIYHCNHLRQLTHLHNVDMKKDFFNPDEAVRNFARDSSASWGLRDIHLEVFDLNSSLDSKRRNAALKLINSLKSTEEFETKKIPFVIDGPLKPAAERTALWLLESLQNFHKEAVIYVGNTFELVSILELLIERQVKSFNSLEALKQHLFQLEHSTHLIFDFEGLDNLQEIEKFIFEDFDVWASSVANGKKQITLSVIGLEYPSDVKFARKFQSRTGDAYTLIQTGIFEAKNERSLSLKGGKWWSRFLKQS